MSVVSNTLILRGTGYTISKDRYGFIKLTPVQSEILA